MTWKPEGEILQERPSGQYGMCYDVVLDNRTVKDIWVEELPFSKLEFIFPYGLTLSEDEKWKIRNLVLWHFYGLDLDEDRGLDEGTHRPDSADVILPNPK